MELAGGSTPHGQLTVGSWPMQAPMPRSPLTPRPYSKPEGDRFPPSQRMRDSIRAAPLFLSPKFSSYLCSSPLSPGEGLAGTLMRNRWASRFISTAPEIVNANCYYLLFCRLPLLLSFFFNNESHLKCAVFAHQKSLIRNPFRKEKIICHVYSHP